MDLRLVLSSMIVFAGLAAISRSILRRFETRWQVLGFWFIAAIWEFGLPPINIPASAPVFIADALGALLGAFAVKAWLEYPLLGRAGGR